MKFPQDCKTSEDKYRFVCKAKEQVRELYNKFSRWADAGITRAEYEQVPEKIKAAFPYVDKLSAETWQKFFGGFKQLQREIAEELSDQRARLEQENCALPIEVDLGEISDVF